MPRPLGRDRLEPSDDGTLVLLSLHPKPWDAREGESTTAPGPSGTAVRWDDELYEVLRVSPRPEGGFRYVLSPWDERRIVRTCLDYGAEPAAATVGDVAAAPSRGLLAALREEPLRPLVVGFAAGVLLGWFLPFRILGEGMSALVHELGHTATAWLFGCSALPAVVVTIAFEQSRVFAALVWAALVAAAVRWRRAGRWNVLLVTAAAVYPFIAFTDAYQVAFTLGGHLAEASVAVWAFRRAMNDGRYEWERAVFAFFGFYLAARNILLFGGVAWSADRRGAYLGGGVAGENDLVKAAAATGVPLPTLAALAVLAFLVAAAIGLAPAARAVRRRRGPAPRA
jgi:hypothetical protein